MNSLIENLNQWAGQLWQFAWPMLWQSSLLIAFVFALDFLLGRKIRASVRYALWLAVLVKLLLPPTLALPTGAAWWLFHAQPVVKTPTIENYTVTYDTTPLANYVPSTVALPSPAPPQLNRAGWALLATGAISTGLLLWLVFRWWQITRMVRGATVSEDLAGLSESVRQQAGLRSRIRLKLVEGRMSPAVCGLFRPVILLPRTLAENLSPTQLRAVLLHEVFHLRRKDVWVNCAQALLQIVYWWHPLLWFANARIRRLREEAVDDAVMLALREEADSYAPTLLEVAKLAFRRPLLSLGLVGIMESRSALRQRIERLVDFRAPRKAGLTFVSLCGICVFSAVALPMGEAPVPVKNEIALTQPSLVVSPAPKPANINTNLPQVLVTTRFYQAAAALKSSQNTGTYVSTLLVPPAEFKQQQANLEAGGYQNFSAPRVVTISGEPASIFVGNGTNSICFFCRPTVTNGLIELLVQGQIVFALNGGLTTNQFKSHAATVENHGAAMISVVHPRSSGLTNLVVLASVEIITNSAQLQQRFQSIIKREPPANTAEAQNLVQDGKLLYEMGKMDEAVVKLKAALALDSENATAKYYLGLVQTYGHVANKLTYTGPGRQSIISKLDRIRLDNVSYDSLPLNEVLRFLAKQSKLHDPDHEGINFLINSNPDKSGQTNDAATGLPVSPTPADNSEPVDVGSFIVNIRNLTDVRLADLLDAIVVTCDHPIKYDIRDFAVVFSVKGPETPQFFSRSFKLDSSLIAAMRNVPDLQTNSVLAMVKSLFTQVGVNLESPKGKSVFYNDKLGALFVKATESDLDTIERAISALNRGAPQIHIKARFLEVPKGLLRPISSWTNSVENFEGILPNASARIALQALEKREGVMMLAEPEVTTTSGRQMQMRATQTTVTIITNFVFEEFPTNQNGSVGSVTAKTGPLETGPIFDVVPYVLSDGYTLYLQMTASSMEFYGYADIPTNMPPLTVTTSTGETVNPPRVWPAVLRYQKSAHVNLFDNQTVILALTNPEQVRFGEPDDKREAAVAKHIRDTAWHNGGRNDILVFVTATIVDPAGNRVHSDDALPFAQTGIPSQPEAK